MRQAHGGVEVVRADLNDGGQFDQGLASDWICEPAGEPLPANDAGVVGYRVALHFAVGAEGEGRIGPRLSSK